MHKHQLPLGAALALAAVSIVAWMLPAATQPGAERTPPVKATSPGTSATLPPDDSPSTRMAASDPASQSGARSSIRLSDQALPGGATPSLTAAPTLPDPRPPEISPRYTLPTQPDAGTLARRLADHPPLERNERVRVVPAEVPSVPGQPAGDTSKTLLILDATLHDPVVWLENEKPLSPSVSGVQARIADEFAASITTAAKDPDTAGKSFDDTWRDARAKANWEYQKFFGGEAANRRAIGAGRAAVSKQ